MDSIHLDLTHHCIVGILARERVNPQPLEIHIGMYLDVQGCAETGALERSINYADVDAQMRFLCTQGKFRLIESLAVAMARLLLSPPAPGEGRTQLHRVSMHIRKPTVMPDACPAVRLERDAAWARGATTLIDVEEVTARKLVDPSPADLEGGEILPLGEGPSVLWVQSRPWSPA